MGFVLCLGTFLKIPPHSISQNNSFTIDKHFNNFDFNEKIGEFENGFAFEFGALACNCTANALMTKTTLR